MKQVWQANDGSLFDSKKECIVHEANTELLCFVTNKCPTTFSEDEGLEVIEIGDVVMFIETNFDKINGIINRKAQL